MRLLAIVAAAPWLLAAGCGAPQEPVEAPAPPFNVREVAWSLFLEDFPELEKAGSKGLGEALAAFRAVVDDKRAPEERTKRQKADRTKACRKGWTALSNAMGRDKELKNQLLIARTYLAAECGLAEKSLTPLRTFHKQYQKSERQLDPLFYAAHFWTAESLLALDRGEAAREEYRWILGELDSPLYPLAMLRTAHAYWDQGDVAEAQSNLEHVSDWIGDRTGPAWVLSLRRRVEDDLRDFSSKSR
jgi:hypothetical protein